MTIPPSPVHPARPRAAWTWILSNHLQIRPLAGSAYRARTAEDTGTRTGKARPHSLPPGPCEPPGAQRPVLPRRAAPRCPCTRPALPGGVVQGWCTQGHALGMPLGYPTTLYHTTGQGWAGTRAPRRCTPRQNGPLGSRRRGVPTAGSLNYRYYWPAALWTYYWPYGHY